MARYFYLITVLVLLLLLLFFPESAKAQKGDSVMVTYTVQRGENLYRISLAYNVSVAQIMYWNHLTNPDDLKAGQQLKLWFKKIEPAKKDEPAPTQADSTQTYTPPNPPPENKPAQQTPRPPETRFSHPFWPTDSIKKQNADPHQLVYAGTRIAPKEEEFDTTGRLDITGYISAYYAYYTDSVGPDAYQKFPTLSPHSNEVGLNLIQISARYKAEKVRGIITLHWGDMPDAAWSPRYNLVQQANMGVRIMRKLWFDIGYFRTHMGLESVQPRENINSTIAIPTYIEPYYLSGAKLTWHMFPFLTVQANAFSQFNGYIENNVNKAVGFSAIADASPQLSFTLNTMLSNDAPDEAPQSKQRWYSDFYMIWKTPRTILGFELNYGTQKNTQLKDSTASAYMLSSLLAFKFMVTKKFSVFARGEYCNDRDGILAGTFSNSRQQIVGVNIWGATAGFEIKPIPNSYVRFEYRRLNQDFAGGDIFYYNGNYRTYRNEFVFSTGFWF